MDTEIRGAGREALGGREGKEGEGGVCVRVCVRGRGREREPEMSNESNMQSERERWTQNRAREAADRSSVEGAVIILLHTLKIGGVCVRARALSVSHLGWPQSEKSA